ncbi:MAG TPA: hypothetical protein VFV94_20730 [Polyangiaceae bacterium]|nr:hypothetical protein [Polyangiaceae bacterium]
MTTRRAISLSFLGLWLVGCGGTADGDDDAMAGTGGVMMVTEGGRGGTSGGSGAGTGGGAASGGTMSGEGAGTGGMSALGGGGGRGGEGQGGVSGGGAGSGGASAGVSGGEPMGGAGGDSGRGMGGRMASGGRMATGGAGGRSLGGMAGMGTSGTSMGGMGMSGSGGGLGDCPANGHVTYTLTKNANPTADEQKAYDLITEAMDQAVDYYNCYTNITKATTVTYVPSVETADGSSNGSIRFGGKDYMEYITAMHEIAHTVGVGTVSQWSTHLVNGIWNGAQATAKLRELTGIADDEVHGDTQHFWPYGLNYTSEVKSEADVINHCYIVVALRADMGL